jgi:hypothetical protein
MLFITTVPQIMPDDFGLARYHSATELRQANRSEYGTKIPWKCFVFRNSNLKSLIVASPEALAGKLSPWVKKGVRFIFSMENKPDTFFLATLRAWFAAIRGENP